MDQRLRRPAENSAEQFWSRLDAWAKRTPPGHCSGSRYYRNHYLYDTNWFANENAKLGHRCVATRLLSFSQSIRQFPIVVDTFVSSNPAVPALVWGSVKLALLASWLYLLTDLRIFHADPISLFLTTLCILINCRLCSWDLANTAHATRNMRTL